MSAQPTPAEPTDDPGQQAAADAQYYRTVLHELIDMSADLARLVHAQATTQAIPDTAEAAPAPDLTLPFDRIARTIRRTVALARKLSEPLPAPATEAAARRRVACRKQIIRAVEDTIHRAVKGAAADTLHAELSERLDAPDLDDDISAKPIADIIADICRDLGLTAPPGTSPWKRRTPRDLQRLAARARGGANTGSAADAHGTGDPASAPVSKSASPAEPATPRPARPDTPKPPPRTDRSPGRDPPGAGLTLLRHLAQTHHR